MGLLGIDSALFLSDRIFNMLDNNNDNSVSFSFFKIIIGKKGRFRRIHEIFGCFIERECSREK